MTGRDRMVLLVVAALVLLGIGWIGVVSPERKHAAKLSAKVVSAQATLASAEAKLGEAKADERRYHAAYASLISLGEAVPANSQVPALIYQVEHASSHAKVQFQSITAGGSGESAAAAAAPSTESSSAAAGASPAGATATAFQSLPFTFTFQGSFKDLYHLMARLQGFARGGHAGKVDVSGRLLTVQSLTLAPGGSSEGAEGSSGQLTGTVSASAYVLPAGVPATAGATPAGPEGAQPGAGEQSAAAAAPAVIKAGP